MMPKRTYRYTDDEMQSIRDAIKARDAGAFVRRVWDPILLAHEGRAFDEQEQHGAWRVGDYQMPLDQNELVKSWLAGPPEAHGSAVYLDRGLGLSEKEVPVE